MSIRSEASNRRAGKGDSSLIIIGFYYVGKIFKARMERENGMPLILRRRLLLTCLAFTPAGIMERATQIGFEIDKKILSQIYELTHGTTVEGEILSINRITKELSLKEIEILDNLKGRKITFLLWIPLFGTKDYLLLTKDSLAMLRDYAIIPDEYVFDIRITKASYGKREINIYPKRDLIVE